MGELRTESFEIGSKYPQRLAKADEIKERFRAGGEFWKVGFGNFIPLVYDSVSFERYDIYELRGLELLAVQQIADVLSAKRLNGDQSPVVLMDFGGMYGISTIKLARVMKDFVASGDVAFVVTNLAFTPEYGLATVGKGYNDLTPSEERLIRDYKHLVHYVESDARELREKSIRVPGKGEVQLYGNVDIVHEDFALAHSFIPDTDLPTLVNAMSNYGILFLGSTGIHPFGDDALESQRVKAFEVGERNMLRAGVKRITYPSRVPHFEIYAKPLAPLDNIPGGEIRRFLPF